MRVQDNGARSQHSDAPSLTGGEKTSTVKLDQPGAKGLMGALSLKQVFSAQPLCDGDVQQSACVLRFGKTAEDYCINRIDLGKTRSGGQGNRVNAPT